MILPWSAWPRAIDRDAGKEEFYREGQAALALQRNDPVLYFIQRLRDEAHRWPMAPIAPSAPRPWVSPRWTRCRASAPQGSAPFWPISAAPRRSLCCPARPYGGAGHFRGDGGNRLQLLPHLRLIFICSKISHEIRGVKPPAIRLPPAPRPLNRTPSTPPARRHARSCSETATVPTGRTRPCVINKVRPHHQAHHIGAAPRSGHLHQTRPNPFPDTAPTPPPGTARARWSSGSPRQPPPPTAPRSAATPARKSARRGV